MSVSPIIRAILTRSPRQLQHEIARCPQETLGLIHGLTAIQWSVGWPQGLRLLLNTDARAVIDTTGYPRGKSSFLPIEAALGVQCEGSLKALLEAGCDLYVDDPDDQRPGGRRLAIKWSWHLKSAGCVSVFVTHLAARRKELLQLARQHLPEKLIEHNGSSTYIPDGNASYLCAALDEAEVPVPKRLRVPEGFGSLYHLDVPLRYFSIFLEAGFRDCNLSNEMGLTPIMVWRDKNFCFEMTSHLNSADTFVAIERLGNLGFLDTLPVDRKKLGVNTRATGWHFLSSLFGATLFLHFYCPVTDQHNLTNLQSFLDNLPNKARDGCTCWCNLDGKGCSPMTSLYKSHCRPLHGEMGMKYKYGFIFITDCTTSWVRHAFFHHAVSDHISLNDNHRQITPSNRALEMVRLLTFEALDMTHTCCRVRCLLHDGKVNVSCSHRSLECKKHIALKSRDPKFVQEIREEQQQAAEHLTTLMSEFTEVMVRMPPSPRGLEAFIWGYWRRRMAEFYAVNSEVLEAMNLVVDEVETCKSCST